jgi:hypothetical protein
VHVEPDEVRTDTLNTPVMVEPSAVCWRDTAVPVDLKSVAAHAVVRSSLQSFSPHRSIAPTSRCTMRLGMGREGAFRQPWDSFLASGAPSFWPTSISRPCLSCAGLVAGRKKHCDRACRQGAYRKRHDSR